jgi:hypothetical protein
VGASWIFTCTNNVWTQRGKLIPTQYYSTPQAGTCVSISENGNEIAVGGPYNGAGGSGTGGVWVFV